MSNLAIGPQFTFAMQAPEAATHTLVKMHREVLHVGHGLTRVRYSLEFQQPRQEGSLASAKMNAAFRVGLGEHRPGDIALLLEPDDDTDTPVVVEEPEMPGDDSGAIPRRGYG